MPVPRCILVVDHDARRRVLAVATLARVFPDTKITEFDDVKSVKPPITILDPDVIVGQGVNPTWFIHHLRAAGLRCIIVIMGNKNDETETIDAGDARFVCSEEWLLLGSAISEELHPR